MNLRLANESWESLLRAHTVLMRRYHEDDIWEDLSMTEYDVLYTLAKAKTPMRLNDLRDGVLLSQPALSRLIQRLSDRGLITRKEDTTDRRALMLKLTDSGIEKQKRVGRAHAKSVAKEMAPLEQAEMKQLKALCQKLVNEN